MTEIKNRPSHEQVWRSLDDKEKEVCINFAVSHWGSGVDEDYTEFMDMDKGVLQALQEKGIVEAKPTWELFDRMASQVQSQAETIRVKMKDIGYRLGDDEREILQSYDGHRSVADRKNTEPRFHLVDEKFHNFIEK